MLHRVDFPPDALKNMLDLIGRVGWQKEQQLIPAEPYQHILFRYIIADDLRHHGKRRISRIMPVGIVAQLKIININDGNPAADASVPQLFFVIAAVQPACDGVFILFLLHPPVKIFIIVRDPAKVGNVQHRMTAVPAAQEDQPFAVGILPAENLIASMLLQLLLNPFKPQRRKQLLAVFPVGVFRQSPGPFGISAVFSGRFLTRTRGNRLICSVLQVNSKNRIKYIPCLLRQHLHFGHPAGPPLFQVKKRSPAPYGQQRAAVFSHSPLFSSYHPFNAFSSISRIILGLPFPLEALMHCPTRKPSALVLPPR